MHDASPAPRERLRAWSGLAAYYAATFAVLAVYLQFFPLWLHRERGLNGEQVSWVFTAVMAARTIAGPLWAQRVDRTGRPRRVLVQLSLLSLLGFAAFGAVADPWLIVLCGLLFGCTFPAVHAIQDAFALHTARTRGFAYARLRLIGSLAFLVTTVAVGTALDVAPTTLVFQLGIVGLVLVAAASFGLPATRTETHVRGSGRSPIGALLRSRRFVLLLVVAALIQGSHAVYYNLSAIHWREHGIPESVEGLLWAEGVLAETIVFFFARSSLERLRPTTMLALGGILAVVRWTVLGLTTSVPVLFAANWLHGFSFGCAYLGALRAADRRVLPSQRATAQGLLGAASYGIGLAIAAPIGGRCYRLFGGGAFFAMAAFALAGAGLALVLRGRRSQATSAQSSAPQAPA